MNKPHMSPLRSCYATPTVRHCSRKLTPSSSMQTAADRERAHALAAGGVDRVAQRRGDAGGAGLADTTRAFAARHQMHLDPRRRGDPQRWKIIEVVLLHAPVGDG